MLVLCLKMTWIGSVIFRGWMSHCFGCRATRIPSARSRLVGDAAISRLRLFTYGRHQHSGRTRRLFVNKLSFLSPFSTLAFSTSAFDLRHCTQTYLCLQLVTPLTFPSFARCVSSVQSWHALPASLRRSHKQLRLPSRLFLL